MRRNKFNIMTIASGLITFGVLIMVINGVTSILRNLPINNQLDAEKNYQYPTYTQTQTQEAQNLNSGVTITNNSITNNQSTEFNYEMETNTISNNYDNFYNNITDDLSGSLTLEGFDIEG